MQRAIRILGLFLAVIFAESAFGFSCGTDRHATDYPDDSTEPQFHVMYVLPADGHDRRQDVDGRICRSILAMNRWMSIQTVGYGLRFDTYLGALDVTFVRLPSSDREMRALGRGLVTRIEWTLRGQGFLTPGKVYAVFYGGTSQGVCGGAAYPPAVPGQVAAIYLNDADGAEHPRCESGEPRGPDSPGYSQFALLHDLLHVLGFVPSCAPNYGSEGHVDDNPLDLMYTGSRTWMPTVLDSGNDDYYGHGRSDCMDLARSPYLTRGVGG